MAISKIVKAEQCHVVVTQNHSCAVGLTSLPTENIDTQTSQRHSQTVRHDANTLLGGGGGGGGTDLDMIGTEDNPTAQRETGVDGQGANHET